MKTKDWVKTKVKKGQKESERGKKWKRIIKGQKGRTKGLKSQKWQKKKSKNSRKKIFKFNPKLSWVRACKNGLDGSNRDDRGTVTPLESVHVLFPCVQVFPVSVAP